jgi:hypothetical protein
MKLLRIASVQPNTNSSKRKNKILPNFLSD